MCDFLIEISFKGVQAWNDFIDTIGWEKTELVHGNRIVDADSVHNSHDITLSGFACAHRLVEMSAHDENSRIGILCKRRQMLFQTGQPKLQTFQAVHLLGVMLVVR